MEVRWVAAKGEPWVEGLGGGEGSTDGVEGRALLLGWMRLGSRRAGRLNDPLASVNTTCKECSEQGESGETSEGRITRTGTQNWESYLLMEETKDETKLPRAW